MYISKNNTYENNMYVITNLDSVINVNSLTASIRATHNTLEKDTTFFHNFWQIIYCQSGKCTWKIDGKIYVMERDTCIITPPHTVRKYEESAEGTVLFFLSFYSNSTKLKNIQKKLIHISLKLKRKLFSAISDINSHFRKELIYLYPTEKTSDIDLQRIKCKLERFLLDLYLTQFNNDTETSNQQSHAAQDEYFEIAIKYMQDNVKENLNVNDIITKIGIGKTTLEGIFKKREGVGIMTYFTRTKIDLAKEMILRNNCSMTNIAQELGFSSVHNFSRTFKKMTGVSPKKYQSFF